MKNIFLRISGFIFIGLIIANLFMFVSGIVLSDEINSYELKTESLRKKNLNLEKDAANLSSLKFAQEQAIKFNFTNSSTPQALDELTYAYRP